MQPNYGKLVVVSKMKTRRTEKKHLNIIFLVPAPIPPLHHMPWTYGVSVYLFRQDFSYPVFRENRRGISVFSTVTCHFCLASQCHPNCYHHSTRASRAKNHLVSVSRRWINWSTAAQRSCSCHSFSPGGNCLTNYFYLLFILILLLETASFWFRCS